MNNFQKAWRIISIAAILAGALNLGLVPVTSAQAAGTVSLTGFGAYTQNFDALASSGTANTTVPTGWDFSETGTGANTTYAADGGTANSGNTYSYGTTSATERAFGGLQSGSVTPTIGASFTNNTGSAVASLAISYTGEQWRLGATGRADRLDFQYSLDATSLTTGAWINVDALDFSSPITTGTTGALDGNAVANRAAVSSSITGLNIANGSTFWIRWQDLNATSSDDGLSVDDFSLTPVAAGSALSINDVTLPEGNSGSTNATFTVSLSSPAPVGGVTFDIATADISATAGSDYTALSLTGQTIAAGNSSATFDVAISGDTTFEPNETFNVNVTNVAGATVTDGIGLGTITNEDVAPPVLSVTDVTKAEGNSGTTTFGFVVNLDVAAPLGGVTFDIATADNTATVADSDYLSQNLTLQTIPAGSSSYNFDVVVNGETNIELTESFFVDVTNVTGATVSDAQGLGTITNDDAVTPEMTINDVSIAEGDAGTSTATFTVSLNIPALAGGVTFDIATANNTATAGSDYAANSATGVTIAEGTSTATFDVTVNGDTTVELNETYSVNVTNVTGATVGDGAGLGTITNDDATPPVLSINDVSVTEGNAGTVTATFTVSLDIPALAGGVTFDIATADGTATVANSDYVVNSLSAQTITAGSSSASFAVTVNGDTDFEPNETFFVNVTNVTGATVSDAQGQGTITNDDAAVTPIYTIQGSGAATGLSGTITTQGVVVSDDEGASPTLGGFYIQDATGDANPATSDGLFIYNNSSANNVSLGQLVRVTGTVAEYNGQTQITASSITVLSSGNTITPTDITLPFASASQPEQYEGMLVRFNQTLYVTEHYLLGRIGQVTLSGSGKLYQPTGIALPGAPAAAIQAANDLNKIILDDALNNQNADPIVFGRGGSPLSASNTLRGGDTIANLTGVFTYTWGGNSVSPNAYRIRPINAMGGGSPNFVAANARPATPPTVGGTTKVVGMNLLNYFNTFGNGACTGGVGGAATDCRGAENSTEFTRQSDKTVAAMTAMSADVFGIVEIENDGYGPTSAIQDLVNKLNTATAPGTYAFINPDTANGTNSMGDDAIKVGFIYKPAVVTPVGTTAVLDSVAFINGGDSAARNRVSLLQAFQTSTGERFLANINHLKSKGSACDDPDTGDGQGNCNIVRTNAANTLAAWIATNPTGTGDPDVVILGDLNSYAKEDPIAALETAGYTNLGNHFGGASTYSYVFDGQWGYLDYALGSASLLTQTVDVEEWHINSDEPSVLDYNTNFKSAGQIISLYAPDQYRISDHDPVMVGLNLINSATPTVTSIVRVGASPTSAASVEYKVTFSENVVNVNAADFVVTPVTGTFSGTNITGISGSGSIYTVTVSTGTGSGTLRLDVAATSDIEDLAGSPLGGLPYTGGESYVIAKGPIPDPWIGGVSIASDQSIVAVARPHLGSEVASYIGSAAGATTQYVPMLFKGAFGGTYNAALYIQNVSASSASLTLEFTNDSGTVVYTKTDTLDPHASKGYWLPAEVGLPAGFAGGVKVTSTQPILAVGRPHIGAQVMTYNGMSAGATSAWLPMFFKNGFGSYNTALYVQNVTGSSANLTIEYINLDGTVACTDNDILGANASKGYWSLAITCDTGSLPSGFVGGVKVTSTQNILAVGRAHLGTQITTYNGSAAGATSAYVPMLFKNAFSGGSYDAALYLQNVSGSSATVTIEYLNSAGTVAATQNVTLAANAISSIWLPSLVSLADGFAGGARITSTQDVIAVARPHLGSEISAYNGAPAGSLNASLPMLFKNAYGGGYDAAFYVQNTSGSAANVEISFYDSAGVLSCVKSIDLAAGATEGFWMPTVTCTP